MSGQKDFFRGDTSAYVTLFGVRFLFRGVLRHQFDASHFCWARRVSSESSPAPNAAHVNHATEIMFSSNWPRSFDGHKSALHSSKVLPRTGWTITLPLPPQAYSQHPEILAILRLEIPFKCYEDTAECLSPSSESPWSPSLTQPQLLRTPLTCIVGAFDRDEKSVFVF